MIRELTELFKNKGYSVAVAESVTAGELQKLLTNYPGASEFFQGGITAYNLEQKVNILGIDKEHALKFNCVSTKVAKDMAIGVNKLFNSDYGIATTGFANGNQDIFYAHFALAHKDKLVLLDKIDSDEINRIRVKEDLAYKVLTKIYQYFSPDKLYTFHEGNAWDEREKKMYKPLDVPDKKYNSLTDLNDKAKYLLVFVDVILSDTDDKILQYLVKKNDKHKALNHLEKKYIDMLKQGKTYHELPEDKI